MSSRVDLSDENYLRLLITVKKLGLKLCLDIFNQHFPKHSDRNKQATHLYQALLPYKKRLKKRLLPYQKNILFASPNYETNIEDLDLSLILAILDEVNDYRAIFLKALQKKRNKLAHPGSKPLSNQDFTIEFNEIKTILVDLGATSDEVDSYRTATLDVSDTEKLTLIQELSRENIRKRIIVIILLNLSQIHS